MSGPDRLYDVVTFDCYGTLVDWESGIADAFARAVAAGAKVTMPVADAFWGDRYGKIEDPFGHHWSVGTHMREVSIEEAQRAMQQMGG